MTFWDLLVCLVYEEKKNAPKTLASKLCFRCYHMGSWAIWEYSSLQNILGFPSSSTKPWEYLR